MKDENKPNAKPINISNNSSEVQKKPLEGEQLIVNLEEIEDYKNIIICMICQELIVLKKKPVYCLQCNTATFCTDCIEKWRARGKDNCPNCQVKNPVMKSIQDNPLVGKLLQTVKVYCKFRPMGCEEIFTFDQIEIHESECGSCVYCNQEVLKKDMRTHMASACNNYQLTCQFCSKQGSRLLLKKYHECH